MTVCLWYKLGNSLQIEFLPWFWWRSIKYTCRILELLLSNWMWLILRFIIMWYAFDILNVVNHENNWPWVNLLTQSEHKPFLSFLITSNNPVLRFAHAGYVDTTLKQMKHIVVALCPNMAMTKRMSMWF